MVAVGTTTVRALESAAATGQLRGPHRACSSTGPYDWQVVDLLLTNFHLPRTTLLMMIDAFVGPRWRDLYAVALADGYRFLSFGDAMLLRRGAAHDARRSRFEVDGHRRRGAGPASPTRHAGAYRTPCFMPVGTGARSSTCRAADYERPRRARSCSATPTT